MNTSIKGMNILADKSIAQKYNIPGLPLYIVKESIEDFPGKSIIPHWNEGLEVLYIQSGSMDIVVNGERTTLNEQDICIISAGCVHYIEAPDERTCTYYCGIADESIFTASEDITTRYINPIFHSFDPDIEVIPCDSKYSRPLKDIFRKIAYYASEKPPVYDLHIVACFHECLALLSEALYQSFFHSKESDSKSDEAIRRMLTYIHKNYSKPISTQSLCEAGDISRNQCFQLFSKYAGDTPANFVLKYRLNVSRQYLANSELPISQIATSCGFTHQSHFTNHFSKHFGITPLKFRQIRRSKAD